MIPDSPGPSSALGSSLDSWKRQRRQIRSDQIAYDGLFMPDPELGAGSGPKDLDPGFRRSGFCGKAQRESLQHAWFGDFALPRKERSRCFWSPLSS
jgi:hypothetical protein